MNDQVTHYQGSRGSMEIATMPHSYLLNAHRKLADTDDGSRAAEVAAMAAQIAINNEQYAEAEAAKAQAERVA